MLDAAVSSNRRYKNPTTSSNGSHCPHGCRTPHASSTNASEKGQHVRKRVGGIVKEIRLLLVVKEMKVATSTHFSIACWSTIANLDLGYFPVKTAYMKQLTE
jgi:hypothetical protein